MTMTKAFKQEHQLGDITYLAPDILQQWETKLAACEDAEEQRNKGCTYCNENRLFVAEESDCLQMSVRLNPLFCPMCGRKLKEDANVTSTTL